MTLSDLESRDVTGQTFLEDLRIMHQSFESDQIWLANTSGGRVSRGSETLCRKGCMGPSVPQIFGTPTTDVHSIRFDLERPILVW